MCCVFSHALNDLAVKAHKGEIGILKVLWRLEDCNPFLLFNLFDAEIKRILLYDSEVWGLCADNNIILFAFICHETFLERDSKKSKWNDLRLDTHCF